MYLPGLIKKKIENKLTYIGTIYIEGWMASALCLLGVSNLKHE